MSQVHSNISGKNVREFANFRAAVCSLSLLMMQSLSQHSSELIKQRELNDRANQFSSTLEGELCLILRQESVTSVIEDDKFRLSVASIAQSLSRLLKDLEEAYKAISSPDDEKPSLVFPDVTKLGLRYMFHEGMGFVEYGVFEQPSDISLNESSSSSLFTEVRSDKSMTH